ncbi:hypothetical protein GQX73_g8983 [Xylaria multiplex]|uniref:Fucose-specific lectin n=1 Tax=Xylaria multiplex TaxID=323545 RepID=A0A7C8IV67_9PEZI|nr:hypothetical protein GQX73_g8983 [Xylaria multiplex]
MDMYSDLEVAPAGRVVLQRYDWVYPEAVPPKRDSTLPEVAPLEYKAHGKEVFTGIRSSPPGKDLSSRDTRRKCGLPVRVFYAIVVILVVVVIGAIAGGVAGGLSASKSRHASTSVGNSTSDGDTTNNGNMTSNENSTSPTIRTNILAASRLSSTNWTDPNGFVHRFVFFQDASSAIIARRWESQNRTWTTNNLTAILLQSRSPLNTLTPYTPLASAACYLGKIVNEIHLWYFLPDNTIIDVAVYNLIDDPENWQHSGFGGSPLTASPGSQLAAAWTRCWADDCVGWWTVAFQRLSDGAISVANASDFNHPSVAVESEDVAENSSLALIPELQVNSSSSVTRLTMLSESLTTSSSGLGQKATYETETTWFSDGQVFGSRSLPAPSPTLQFAITRLDNFAAIIFLALLPNGTVTGDYWHRTLEKWIEIPSVEFRDGPDVNFSAIATSEEAMFYGISTDEILQYSVDAEDPSVFNFIERVYP